MQLRSSTREVLIAVAIAITSLGVAYGLSHRRAAESPRRATDFAPADTVLLVEVDVQAWVRSRLWADMPGSDGLSKLERECGFDPVSLIERAWLIRRREGDDSFLAEGDFRRADVVACLERTSSEHGFRRVEVEGIPALAGREGTSRAAFLPSGRLVFAEEESLRTLIRVERRREPTLSEAGGDLPTRFARLPDRTAVRAAYSIASVPGALLDRIPELAPVRNGDLAFSFGDPGALTIHLDAGTSAQAEALKSALIHALEALRSRLGGAMLRDVGALLAGMRIDHDGAEVRLATSVTRSQLATLRALAVRFVFDDVDSTSPSGQQNALPISP